MEIVSEYRQSREAEIQELRVVSREGYQKYQRQELESGASREQVKVDIRTAETYITYKAYTYMQVGKSRVNQVGTR